MYWAMPLRGITITGTGAARYGNAYEATVRPRAFVLTAL